MLDKLKLIYKLSPLLLLAITGFSIYFGYNCWQDEITAKAEVKKLNNQIEQLQQKQIKTNQCANELVPSAYADRLYNRANQIRQSANTSQSIN